MYLWGNVRWSVMIGCRQALRAAQASDSIAFDICQPEDKIAYDLRKPLSYKATWLLKLPAIRKLVLGQYSTGTLIDDTG